MYIQLVAQHTLVDSVAPAVIAFREGFAEVAPLRALRLFFPHELSALLCGADDKPWDPADLLGSIVCEHGYTHSSPVVQYLVGVLSSFDSQQRRAFLQFATGNSRLPIGGFAGLHPRMTVVRRPTDGDPDLFLPSVMTCTNYLKVPEYSSAEMLRARLVYAMTEGQQAFQLS